MSDQEVKALLSEYLYQIQDNSLQILIRVILFGEKVGADKNIDWQEVYRLMTVFLPEVANK